MDRRNFLKSSGVLLGTSTLDLPTPQFELKKKIREVKDSLALDYEAIMWRIAKTEVKRR